MDPISFKNTAELYKYLFLLQPKYSKGRATFLENDKLICSMINYHQWRGPKQSLYYSENFKYLLVRSLIA